jgi:hypothetical protein
MGAPQIIMIILFALSLGINLSKHGEAKIGTYSFPLALVSVIIEVTILWWGGFF